MRFHTEYKHSINAPKRVQRKFKGKIDEYYNARRGKGMVSNKQTKVSKVTNFRRCGKCMYRSRTLHSITQFPPNKHKEQIIHCESRVYKFILDK